MKHIISIGTATAAALICSQVLAMTPQEQRMRSATDVIQDFTNIPENAIPENIMNNAYGIAVIPSYTKVGFGFGGSWGKGVLTLRHEDGTWSHPSFIKMGGGSFGWQIGAQSTDMILIFKDRRSIDNIVNGKFTIGGNASAAAGPVGRSGSASTDGQLTAEIYSYSRNRGLFAGVSIDGNWIGMDNKANGDYYGNGMTPQQIMDNGSMPTPLTAQNFMEVLVANAPGAGFARNRTASIDTMPAIEPQTGSGDPSFGIEPVTGGSPETTF
jgi:lipid-binding SYLF domain-containing protein